MTIRLSRPVAVAILALAASAGIAARAAQQPPDPPARPDLVTQPYNDADVAFVSGMIPHHAQAVIMAGWAPTHGARPDVAILCEKIVVAQRDEIFFMRNWLRDRDQVVPSATETHHKMTMNGMTHDELMPGMLSDEEMVALDKSRGPEFDRLFLTGMIKHHQGAITMVNALFNAYGSMRDDNIYKFASDVFADQSTEITRMQEMLKK
jgi:uncharacterized protein (DUF305 family)